jgi:hypothetical protein
LAAFTGNWDDRAVLPAYLFRFWRWGSDPATWKAVVRLLSQHSGVPALLVAALLLVIGWRLLKKSARFFAEVAVVTAALFAATQLGWIRW